MVVEFFLGPGEMRVSFDLNKNRQSLVIYVGEIKDVKLPAGKTFLLYLTVDYAITSLGRCNVYGILQNSKGYFANTHNIQKQDFYP